MLRASSLFYALAIAVIMAIVSSSLLLAAHYSSLNTERDEMREEVVRNSNSGIQLLLADESDNYNTAVEVDLFGNGNDSVLLQKKSWGAFEIAISKAHNKFFSKELIASVGWQGSQNDNTALTLADLDHPLYVTGSTKLTGECYLPKSGIERAYIEENSYSGDKLVYGNIKSADRFLPDYNDTLIKRLKNLFEFIPGQNDSFINEPEFEKSDSVYNSFLNKPLYVFNDGTIIIDAQNISGQVCVISRKLIRVEKNSAIHNALLIAPKIVIDDECQGDFQAFAKDSLIVGEKVKLHYPTVLGIIGTEKSPDFISLAVGEKSKIFGQLFACVTENDFRKHAIISTQKESVVYGEIYSGDLVDHKGTVLGNITCAKFELKTSSGEYENHLMNAVIDRTKRSSAFVSSAIARKKTDHKKVVQWLE